LLLRGAGDDPEAEQVLQQVRRAGAALPRAARDRVHLACLPMEDLEENAAMVNAIQRRADVIVQKSLAEGFVLIVAEAMSKAPAGAGQPGRGHPGPDPPRPQRAAAGGPQRPCRLRPSGSGPVDRPRPGAADG
jgi:hypothetical protein